MLSRTVTSLSKFFKESLWLPCGAVQDGSEKVITVDKAREGSGGTVGEMELVQGIYWRQQGLVYKSAVVKKGRRVIPSYSA